ncbi:hypothetical protein D3C84_593440 [compost metagenome]
MLTKKPAAVIQLKMADSDKIKHWDLIYFLYKTIDSTLNQPQTFLFSKSPTA